MCYSEHMKDLKEHWPYERMSCGYKINTLKHIIGSQSHACQEEHKQNKDVPLKQVKCASILNITL